MDNIDKRIAVEVMGLEKIYWPIVLGEYTPPPYSTNISDAWSVIEKMRELGYSMNLGVYAKAKVIQCHFVSDEIITEISDAETAPMAICLAALKGVANE